MRPFIAAYSSSSACNQASGRVKRQARTGVYAVIRGLLLEEVTEKTRNVCG